MKGRKTRRRNKPFSPPYSFAISGRSADLPDYLLFFPLIQFLFPMKCAAAKRFFGLRPQNDKRRQCILCLVILSASEESFHSAPICIPCIRHCEERSDVAIRFFRIAHLRQICGFAGILLLLSVILGTPLSLLVQRKRQRKHTKAGREKSPRLAIHPSAR